MLNPLIEKYVSEDKKKEAYERLRNNEAIQYIIGNVDFCGNIIKVDKRVLIPRFETEGLVEKTCQYAKKMFNKKIKIIDLGTGSGCIAITLKKMLDADVLAIDVSLDALDLARENATKNKVDISFMLKNMEEKPDGMYDIIISNPPYIPEDGFVEDIVYQNEPHKALFASDSGLYFYKKILSYAFDILNKPGLVAFEIGDNQKCLLEEYLQSNFKELKYEFLKDLAGMDRYLFIFNE